MLSFEELLRKADLIERMITARMDAKADAKARAKAKCRDKPLTNRAGRIVKPATVQCGRVCRQEQNCTVTKTELKKVRSAFKGKEEKEMLSAVKALLASKRDGQSSTRATYEATEKVRKERNIERREKHHQKSVERSEARKTRQGAPSRLKAMPKATARDIQDFNSFVDQDLWQFDGQSELQTDYKGTPMAVSVDDYRVHQGHRYYKVIPKGGKGKSETHFWAKEETLEPRTAKAKGIKAKPLPSFRPSTTRVMGSKRMETVESKQLGNVHIVKALGKKAGVVAGGEDLVALRTQKGAQAYARALHDLLEQYPDYQKILAEGGSWSSLPDRESSQLLRRAFVAAEKDLHPKDKSLFE